MVIHGEEPRQKIEWALKMLRECKIDVLITTLDLIHLGIDIPSVSVIHFHGMPDDYTKFVQGYGRSARRGNACALVFVWLKYNSAPERYYLVHFRDLFLYRDRLMPIIPINRWFPDVITTFVPSATLMYALYNDERASTISAPYSKKKFYDPSFQLEVKNFLVKVSSEPIYPEDEEIAERAIDEGFTRLKEYIQRYLHRLADPKYRLSKKFYEDILLKGIRGIEEDVVLMPTYIDRHMVRTRLERGLVRESEGGEEQ